MILNMLNEKKMNNTKWYKYSQNNSGGYFEIDENLDRCVFIEETSIENANKKAENIGIYFDGVQKDLDCKCCGDRWHPVVEFDSFEENEIVTLLNNTKFHFQNGYIASIKAEFMKNEKKGTLKTLLKHHIIKNKLSKLKL